MNYYYKQIIKKIAISTKEEEKILSFFSNYQTITLDNFLL